MADTYYNRFVPNIGTPEDCSLTVEGTSGSTSYKYQIVGYNWNGETLPCDALTVALGNAILSVTDYNHLEWDIVEGASGYAIYGRIDDATYGLLYKAQASSFIEVSPARLAWNDQGQNTPDPLIQPSVTDNTGRQNWDALLFRANKSLQSAEVNEIQEIQDRYLDNLGRSLFAEGGIIRGCSPTMGDDGITVTIPEGEIYIKGKVRYIAGGVVTITGIDSEAIGLIVDENIITELDDPTLYDPAVGAYNYGKDSAHRRSYTFTWTSWAVGYNTHNAVKVFSVDSGAIIVASSETDYSKINKLLALRTFEESGNYVVEDTPILIKDAVDPDKLDVYVNALKAYVQGYRIERTKGTVLPLNKARDFQNVAEEQFSFTSGAGAGNYIYRLSNNYVGRVNQCFATLGDSDSVTKGSPGGQDYIHASLVNIVSVIQGGTTYTFGVDYIRTGNYVDWSPGGTEPVTGTSYTVTYTYRKGLVQGVRTKTHVANEAVTRGGSPNTADNLAHTDIISITSVSSLSDGGGTVYQENLDWYMVNGQDDAQINDNGQVHWNLSGPEPAGGSVYYVTYDYWEHTVEGEYVCSQSYDDYSSITEYNIFNLRDCIDFRHPIGYSGLYPEDDNINVNYDYYLPRRDIIVVNTEGSVFLMEGISDVLPARPKIQENCMGIAELYVMPYTYDATDVDITTLEVKRSTMEDIKTIEKRVTTIEYFQALDLLEQEAIDEYTVDAKTGILVDNFKGSSRADVYFDRGGITFGVAFDTARGCIQTQTPFSNYDLSDYVDGANTTAQITGKVCTLPYTHVICQSQPYASQMVCVTPYLVFPYVGQLWVTPSEDYWVDTTQAADLRVNQGASLEELEFWADNAGAWDIEATAWENHITGVSTNVSKIGKHTASSVTVASGFSERQVTSISLVPETTTLNMGDRIIDTSIIAKMRSRIINLTGAKFRPNTELALKMEDIVLPMVPVAPTVAGANSGCIMTDAQGHWEARFTIPANTFNTGEREIKVYNYDGLSNHETYAAAVYNAMGISQTRQATYLTTTYLQPTETVRTETKPFSEVTAVRTWKVDPLAQTFYYPQSFFLTQIGLYFATKDPVLPAIVELRTVDNGYPSGNILAAVELLPSAITTSSDATAETKVTLPEPVYIEKEQWYCVVIKANTTEYNVWVATMGGKDVTTGGMITKQTNDGVLFRSSNASTWVADPTSDLKFNLYRANFSLSANLTFDTFTGIDASIFNLTDVEINPGNVGTDSTSITWQMDDQPVSSYLRILKANETVYLGTEVASVKIRGVFSSNNSSLSPVLNMEKLGLMKARYQTGTRSYISRNVDLSPNTFTKFKIIYEANKPNNTDIRIYYTNDNGYTWTEFISPSSVAVIDTFWTEYKYDESLSSQNQFRIRVDLISTTTGNTPRVRKLRVITY